MVPGILAIVHTTYGHPGVARTTELVQRKYHWTSLKSDVRDYVLYCGCSRRLKKSPARVSPCYQLTSSSPEKSLNQYLRHGSKVGSREQIPPGFSGQNQNIIFAYLLPNKTAENVAKKLLELLLTFRIPLSLRSDPGTEFTAEVASTSVNGSMRRSTIAPQTTQKGSRDCREAGGGSRDCREAGGVDP